MKGQMAGMESISAQTIIMQVRANWMAAPSESEERSMWYSVLRMLNTLQEHNRAGHVYLLRERLAHVSGVSRHVVEQALALFGEGDEEASA